MTSIKLAHAISYVLLDGERHLLREIVDRLRHFIQPEAAVRQRARRLASLRIAGNPRKADRNGTGKTTLCIRKELPKEEEIKVDDAVQYVILRALQIMKNKNGIADLCSSSGYAITPAGREWVKRRLVADGVAKVVKLNLMLKGRLP